MSTSGPDETPPPSELQGLDPKDLLQAGLDTVPPITLPPQPADPDATLRVAGPSQPSAPQVELPLPEELTHLLPGGNYHVESFLGQGGMGAVYKGMQVRLKRPVAIKIMRRDMGKDYDFEARFEREAQAMAKLNHPNIVSVIDFGEAGPDYLYIVMELIDGADLMDVIRGGQMTQEMALTLLPQVCDALQFAHDHGIVHRDIKPSNIMLTRDGRVKMCDFGLAKRYDVESSFRTQTGTGMGTPDYAAPEQFDPKANIDHRADIYALGVMIYQMITGQLPRGVWKPPSQRAEISPQWDDIVSRAMQSDPSDRYQHASDIKTDVSSIPLVESRRSRQTAELPAPTAPHARALASTPTKSRAPLLFGLITSVAIIAVGAFFAFKPAENSGSSAAVETSHSKESSPSSAPPPLLASSAVAWNPKVSRAAAELALTKANSVIIEQNGETQTIGHSKSLPPGDFRFIGFFMGSFAPPQPFDDLAKGITAEEMRAMLAPAEIERVSLRSVRVLDDEIARIIASKPGLKFAGFQHARMTDDLLRHFSQAAQLEDLDLSQCSMVTDVGFAHLSNLPRLRKLGLESTKITIPAVAALKSAGQLEGVSMQWNSNDDAALVATACPSLTRLGLSGTISDEGMRFIAKLKNLSFLRLAKITCSAAHTAALTKMTSLSELALDQCVITDPIALDAALKQMPKLKKVTINGVAWTPNRLASSSSVATATKEAPFTNTLGMKFVPVPGSKVLFCMHETRYQDYQAYAADAKLLGVAWKVQTADGFTAKARNAEHPVVNVSWQEAKSFCEWLSAKEGVSYRLPTDEEWSLAVGLVPPENPSAGITPALLSGKDKSSFPWGGDFPPKTADKAGNYGDASKKAQAPRSDINYLEDYDDGFPTTAPVMSFKPNALGLYDLGGNVWEWCEDWIDDAHQDRVLRGGSWLYSDRAHLLSSHRGRRAYNDRSYNDGFRVVLEPTTPIAP